MQNYHKHTYMSNLYSMDSIASPEDYAKRAVELGHKVLSSTEHGWQSRYWDYYSLAKKYGLKFVFGTEAYYVKDRNENDRENCHIVILAKNENGRQSINNILSEANKTGYYYRPRVDEELIFSLPPDDVFITSRCIAFWNYGYEYADEFVEKMHNYFGNNFMLEIQGHLAPKQVELNQHIKNLAKRLSIEMIVGLDSHYIKPEDAGMRDEALKSKGIVYEQEDGFYMDYPDDQTVLNRFMEQGIWTEAEVQKAMDNTDICLTFGDYEGVSVFSKEIKLPTIYPEKTQQERNKLFTKLISKEFKKYMKDIPKEEYNRYYDGVKEEVAVYRDTGMVDYRLLNYKVIKRGVELGGVITDTARGSARSFFTTTLLGFSKIDRFTSAVELYPSRFMSTTRILETHSLPD